ncbi:MAG: DUF1830 domain-containing protein [Microcoleaceae cyanobacterium MO_207.B10]|nr:DUF1830 domain-containing protein [Microcoleaceae cyanobacterium MO_207.B10]
MVQILDPLPANSLNQLLCCYVNATSQIQIARISNIPNWYFERVVFPGQRLVFEAVTGASLEIHTGMMASSILSDTIPCDRLQINEGPYSSIFKTEQTIPTSVLPKRRKTSLTATAALSSVD